MKCCSLRYHLYSCICCHCCAVWTTSNHICLEANEYCRTISNGCCKNFRASRGSCCAPPAYSSLIWSSTRECVICCCIGVPAKSSLLQWSHISHNMSHSFWMRAKVHQRLDLSDFACFQIFSWWLRHPQVNQPSSIWSHPIWLCSVVNLSLEVLDVVLSLTHCSRLVMIVMCIYNAVPWSFIQWCNDCRLSLHCALKLSAEHRRMWPLSLLSVWQRGQTAVERWPHRCMFLPWAKWPVICLVTHWCRLGVLLLSAHSIACISSISFNCVILGSLFSQYQWASGPFNASCISCQCCWTIFFPVMNSWQGSKGRGRVRSPEYSLWIEALATLSALIFSHASRESTVVWPESWWPLTWEY